MNERIEKLLESLTKSLTENEIVYTIGIDNTEYSDYPVRNEEDLARVISVVSTLVDDGEVIYIYKNHVKISQIIVTKERDDDFDIKKENLVETYQTIIGDYKILLNIERI